MKILSIMETSNNTYNDSITLAKKELAMRDNAVSIKNFADDIVLIDRSAAVKAINGIIQYLEEIKNSL